MQAIIMFSLLLLVPTAVWSQGITDVIVVKDYYPGGKLKTVAHYRDGKRDGLYKLASEI